MTTRSSKLFCQVARAGLLAALFLNIQPGISAAQGLSAGDALPALSGEGVEYQGFSQDEPTTSALALLFIKIDDAHSQQAVESMKELYERHALTRDGSRTVVVVSRGVKDGELATLKIPAGWGIINDSKDTLYTAFGIIATPSLYIADKEGRIVGVHPGYSSSLAELARRDLIRAIHGDSAMSTPSPTPGIMNIQMGRQLARRKLWDRAIGYYLKAAEEMPLPSDAALELATIYLEIEKPAEALATLELIEDQSVDPKLVAEIRSKALKLAEESAASAKPGTAE